LSIIILDNLAVTLIFLTLQDKILFLAFQNVLIYLILQLHFFNNLNIKKHQKMKLKIFKNYNQQILNPINILQMILLIIIIEIFNLDYKVIYE